MESHFDTLFTQNIPATLPFIRQHPFHALKSSWDLPSVLDYVGNNNHHDPSSEDENLRVSTLVKIAVAGCTFLLPKVLTIFVRMESYPHNGATKCIYVLFPRHLKSEQHTSSVQIPRSTSQMLIEDHLHLSNVVVYHTSHNQTSET